MIKRGKDTKLTETAFLPEVSSAVQKVLQRVKIGIVSRSQVDAKTQAIPTYRMALASIQPMDEKIAIKKEGDRSWKWYTVHAEPDLDLETMDVIVLFGESYKVMGKKNWKQYGFIEYSVIEFYRKFGT